MNYRSWILTAPFRWETHIIQRRNVPAGTPVGYNHSVITARESILGVVPIGYSDGYPRSLSNRGALVLVGTTPCPILGIISMNLTIIDLTDAPSDASIVTLIGPEEPVSPAAVAHRAQTTIPALLAGIDHTIPQLDYRPSGSVCQNRFL